MKVYIATKFEDRHIASEWVRHLEHAGIQITHDWPSVEADSDEQVTGEMRNICAAQDFAGVLAADFVWVLAPKTGGRGCWTEMGIALARGIPVVLSGAGVGLNIFDEFSKNFSSHGDAYAYLLQQCDLQSNIRA